jgi:hypothetical protein
MRARSLFAAAKRLYNLFVITLDDEVLVELRVTHFDVLQAEDLADVAEDRRTVNGETKAAGIGKRSPHPRVLDRHRVFAADEDHLCVFIEADGPFSRTRLEFCSAAEAALDISPPISARNADQISSRLGPKNDLKYPKTTSPTCSMADEYSESCAVVARLIGLE